MVLRDERRGGFHRAGIAVSAVLSCGLGVGGLLAVGLTPSAARAQTASQITPPSYAPPISTNRAPIVLPQAASTSAPAGSETLEVTLSDIVVEGGVMDPAALTALKHELVGRPIKVSQIFVAARALEGRYARAGRVLTRVVVPAQNLNDGATLRLTLVEGFIESVDTSRVPGRIRGRVTGLLAPLAGEPNLSMKTIERRLLLAGDVPGATVRSTLAAGQTPGSTVMSVDAVQRPVTGFVAYDNTLPSGLGRDSYGLGIDFNSVLGFGEQVYIRASGLPEGGDAGFFETHPRNRALAAGVIVPIGDDGLTFNLEAVDARTAPAHASALPGFASRYQRLSGRLSYPFIRSRALTVSGELAFDAQDERLSIIYPGTFALSQDKLRIVRVGGTATAVLRGDGVLNARIEGSVGLDGLGARSARDATPILPLSRQGADSSFQKLQLQAGLDQPLAPHLTLALAARAQTSFGQAMANSEQFGIASSDGISPLASGQVQGDAGYVARAELRAPYAVAFGSGRGHVSPYVFGAVGGVKFERPTIFERSSTDANAYGVGVRVSGVVREGAPWMTAGVEYGRAHVEGFGRDTERLNVSVAIRY